MHIDYDTFAREYARHRRAQPEVLKHLVDTAKLDHGTRVLDVGCGTGNYMVALEKAAACACWGVDPSKEMLVEAGKRTRSAHLKHGGAERLDFPAEFFGLVFSVDVIHHVENRPAYFREAYRVLKKGGKICTVTDSESIIRRRRLLSSYFPETIEVELKRYPAMSDLRSMMAEAGFSGIRKHEVEFAYSLTDIQIYRDKAFSCLQLIPEEAFQRGIKRMEYDLRAGPIPCVSRYLLVWGTKWVEDAAAKTRR
jgi:cyclopropane fatty-acyl-phospholipid synthase-like methyltransferase